VVGVHVHAGDDPALASRVGAAPLDLSQLGRPPIDNDIRDLWGAENSVTSLACVFAGSSLSGQVGHETNGRRLARPDALDAVLIRAGAEITPWLSYVRAIEVEPVSQVAPPRDVPVRG
jgi:hypothetical protein